MPPISQVNVSNKFQPSISVLPGGKIDSVGSVTIISSESGDIGYNSSVIVSLGGGGDIGYDSGAIISLE
ncbi:12832_t:CDS:2, partial [Cetraspora pellucida]